MHAEHARALKRKGCNVTANAAWAHASESYGTGESRHAQCPPFLLETLPLMMTGDPGANVCSTFFFMPQPPNIEVTLLPLTLTWGPSSSWEAVDLRTAHFC